MYRDIIGGGDIIELFFKYSKEGKEERELWGKYQKEGEEEREFRFKHQKEGDVEREFRFKNLNYCLILGKRGKGKERIINLIVQKKKGQEGYCI